MSMAAECLYADRLSDTMVLLADELAPALNRPAKQRGLVFDCLRVFAERPDFAHVRPTARSVAHWCDLPLAVAEKTIKHLRELGLVELCGHCVELDHRWSMYRSVVVYA